MDKLLEMSDTKKRNEALEKLHKTAADFNKQNKCSWDTELQLCEKNTEAMIANE